MSRQSTHSVATFNTGYEATSHAQTAGSVVGQVQGARSKRSSAVSSVDSPPRVAIVAMIGCCGSKSCARMSWRQLPMTTLLLELVTTGATTLSAQDLCIPASLTDLGPGLD